MIMIIIAVAISLLVAVYLFNALRTGKLDEKYVWLWLVLALGVIIVAAIPGLPSVLARLLGFQLPGNLIVVSALIVMFLVMISMSATITKMEQQVRTLTEEVAFLRHDVDSDDVTVAAAPGVLPIDPQDLQK